jgi:hypothetical protein
MRANEFITEEIKLDTKARAKAWIEKVYAKYPATWQNNHVMTWGEGDDQQLAFFELIPSMSKKDAVEVKWFQAYPLRQGVGSRAMRELQALAQEDNIALTLYPWDKGQVSQTKLMKFYKGQGFRPTVKGAKNLSWSPEGVTEAFDKPYKGKWEKSDYGDVDMLAKLPDGTNLSIMFNQEYGDEGEEVVQVEFYRNNSQDVTGEGDAQRIFATVLDAIQKYIKKYKPQRLSFSASKAVDMDADDNGAQFNPESRAKLYDRLVQRYSKALGYRAFRADNGDIVIYELSRIKQGVAEGKDTINEYRDRMYQYIKSIVPTWPDYIVKDWLYANFARGDVQTANYSFDTVGKDIPKIIKAQHIPLDAKWQLIPNMKFTMDMWIPEVVAKLTARAGGSAHPTFDIPRDAERHATQAQLAQQQGGVRKEPVILIKRPDGYDLIEGWHRTIQHFAKYPDGYTGPAYVAVEQSQQGVAEGLEVDVPNEDWLQDKIDYAKSKGRNSFGVPYMGSTTASVRGTPPRVRVMRLASLPGMRNEQTNVRRDDLKWLMDYMDTHKKLPPMGSSPDNEYLPYIMVAYNGEAWVNEGNHRIMAAYRLNWQDMPIEIRYFDGGERIESGPMYPAKIGLA